MCEPIEEKETLLKGKNGEVLSICEDVRPAIVEDEPDDGYNARRKFYENTILKDERG